MARKKKTTKGKQKIEMKKIESEEVRQICFSKRRTGLFSKASDLCTLCGSDVAVLVFSPGGKPYSFGSPAMDPVLARFTSNISGSTSGPPCNEVRQLSQQCLELANRLHDSKKKSAMLEEKLDSPDQAQELEWLENMDDLGLHNLSQLAEALKQVKLDADAHVKTLLTGRRISCSNPPAMVANQGDQGASSSHELMAGNLGADASSFLDVCAPTSAATAADLFTEIMASPPAPLHDDTAFGPGFFL